MPLPRLIPCLDVSGGRVVKGVNFVGLREVGDPVELGGAYSDAGADELVFLDISAATARAARDARRACRRVAERLAIPFTVGGGMRTVADAEALLRAGADKVSAQLGRARAAHPRDRSRGTARQPGGRRRDRRDGGRCPLARRHLPQRHGAPRSGRGRARSAERARSCSRRSTRTGPVRVTTWS